MVSKTLSFIHQLTHEPTTSARTYYRLARIGIHCSKLSIKLPAHRFIQTLQGQKDLHLLHRLYHHRYFLHFHFDNVLMKKNNFQ